MVVRAARASLSALSVVLSAQDLRGAGRWLDSRFRDDVTPKKGKRALH